MTDSEKIASLEAKLVSALNRIAELEELLRKKTAVKTSKNSHNPPSSDLARKNQSLREKSGKSPGGQKGHDGHTLEMTSTPDVTEALYPDYCNNCGESLSDSEFEFVSRRQVVDIPPITPITTEYRCFGTKCSCGHEQRASYPDGVTNHIQYGRNIQALAVYQSVYQYVPFARLQDFFRKVCNISIGKGTIENILRRSAQKAAPAYDALQAIISISFFVGSDETGFRVNGKRHWFWVWQNALVTYIVAATSRSKQVISDTFPEGLPNSVLCSDRLAAQLSTISKGSQVCLAHLLRDLNYLIQAENTQWATDFRQLLKDAIKLKQDNPSYGEKDKKAIRIEERANELLSSDVLEAQLSDLDKNRQTRTFFRGMFKLRQALFPFLYDPRIPFDNNGSERAIRNVKVKVKISGQFKSLQKEYATIRSVIDTAIKNGQSVFHAIVAIVDSPIP